MKKALWLVAVFALSIAISTTYQSCGDSSIEANPSSAGTSVPVTTPGETGSDDGGDGGVVTVPGGDGDGDDGGVTANPFTWDNGNNITYWDDKGPTQELGISKLIVHRYFQFDNTIYFAAGNEPNRQLPSDYCANSALPHCLAVTGDDCTGIQCVNVAHPVKCHTQVVLNSAANTNTLQALNELSYLNRTVSATDPMIEGCNNPIFFYNTAANAVEISLANRGCVPGGKNYFSAGGDAVKNIFANQLSNTADAGEFCNKYSSYAWNVTKWSYRSTPGYTQAIDAQYRHVDGEGQLAKLRYKDSGDNKVYCADQVQISAAELDAIFPEPTTGGFIEYLIHRPPGVIADAATAQITYEDPIDGGAVRTFYLDHATSEAHGGGAVLRQIHSDSIKNAVEVLVNRAKSQNLAIECTD